MLSGKNDGKSADFSIPEFQDGKNAEETVPFPAVSVPFSADGRCARRMFSGQCRRCALFRKLDSSGRQVVRQ